MAQYYVYIMASLSRTLYTGVTNDLVRRVFEHRSGLVEFTSRYRINRLVYFESTANVAAAIQREKQIKGMTRRRKISLIEEHNAGWEDLAASWFNRK